MCRVAPSAWQTRPVATGPVVVMMGVSGSGKSTVAEPLAARLDMAFLDADDLHSGAAIAQMHRGVALTPAQRDEWMERVVSTVEQRRPVVLACSGLQRRHRDLLRSLGAVHLVMLDVPADELTRRLATRKAHFFAPELLADQLTTLERPGPDEDVALLDGTRPTADLVEEAAAMLR